MNLIWGLILLDHYGHAMIIMMSLNEHLDAKVFHNETGHPSTNAFVAPSVTTYTDNNPEYRIYEVGRADDDDDDNDDDNDDNDYDDDTNCHHLHLNKPEFRIYEVLNTFNI